MSNAEKIEEIIKDLKDKNFNIYFFTIDTKGNPTGGVANVYEHVKMLGELGFNAHILHDKEEYTSVESWLGEEFAALSHKSTKELNVQPSDMIVVPEVYPNVMEQLAKFPCKKVVFSQSYSYIFELLGIGRTWNYDYKFTDVITTTEAQAEYIRNHFININTSVVAPSVPDYFQKTNVPKKPIVGIMAREQSDVLNIVKSFYLQYPMYKWVTFKDLRGLPKETFAKEIEQNCLSVWVDQPSSFGTFPIESMSVGTPVMGIIPNMVPEWMVEVKEGEEGPSIIDNGIWTDNILNLPNLISEYMKLWLEDSIPPVLYENMDKVVGRYSTEKQKEQIKTVYEGLVSRRIEEFNNALENEKKEDE